VELVEAQDQKKGRKERQAAVTKEKLCIAALQTISEFGYQASTTSLIASRAGVSRGAQTHHYPVKLDLVTAAFSYLINNWESKRRDFFESAGDNLNIESYLDFLWREIFNDPFYSAALEMLLAAKGDQKLERALTKIREKHGTLRIQIWRSILSEKAHEKDIDEFMKMTICLFRGMSLQSSLEDGNKNSNLKMIERWKKYINDI